VGVFALMEEEHRQIGGTNGWHFHSTIQCCKMESRAPLRVKSPTGLSLCGGAMIPEEWMPPTVVLRIICHAEAEEEVLDIHRLFYHFIISKAGGIARGFFSIEDNVAPRHGMAKHTRGLNVGSVGIACVGASHIQERQWEALTELCARLCQRYGLDPSNERQLLCHSEVERVYGIWQGGANDLAGYGDAIRSQVREILHPPLPEPLMVQTIRVNGHSIRAVVEAGEVWIPAQKLGDALSVPFLRTVNYPTYSAEFERGEERFLLPARKIVIYGIEYICIPLRRMLERVQRHARFDERLKSFVVTTEE